jgi:nitrate reductase gamma subunit
MNWFSYLAAGILVYIAVAVFVIGSIYKIVKWKHQPKSAIKQGIFPKPAGSGGRYLKLLKDNFLFPQVLDTDRWMWFCVIVMHLAGLGLFIGHTRIFGDPGFALNTLGEDNLNMLGAYLGGGMGIILLIVFTFFLVRRFKSPYKEVSTPEDYLLLLLILILVLLGDHLRFTHPFELADYRAYMDSLLAFRPAFPEAIAESPSRWILTFHVMTASLLLIYFPFSKLTHFFGSFAANLMRSE